MGGEEKPPPTPSPPNQGRDPCLWVMGRGAVGIRDLWGQLAPRATPGLGASMLPSTGSDVRAGKVSGVATRISKASNSFTMGNRWKGTDLGSMGWWRAMGMMPRPWYPAEPREEAGSPLGAT